MCPWKSTVQSAKSIAISPCQPTIASENEADSPILPMHRTTRASSNGDNTTQQAKEILTMGCMPAVLPARREWTETIVKFTLRDTQIEWPPTDWNKMNPDKKLHAWECVSTQLNPSDRVVLNHGNFWNRNGSERLAP